MSYKYIESKKSIRDKQLLKSHPKNVQSKLLYLVKDILDNPRNKNTIGKPEQLKYYDKEVWSRELTQKDRIVYGIELGKNYKMPEENEIVVFYQYLDHYADK